MTSAVERGRSGFGAGHRGGGTDVVIHLASSHPERGQPAQMSPVKQCLEQNNGAPNLISWPSQAHSGTGSREAGRWKLCIFDVVARKLPAKNAFINPSASLVLTSFSMHKCWCR